MIPVLSADARYAPEWVNVMAHIAVSCAWKMVSKLKVNPLHRVNLPLVEPVRTRRDSGVHCIPVQLVHFGFQRVGVPLQHSLDIEFDLSTCARISYIVMWRDFRDMLLGGGAKAK